MDPRLAPLADLLRLNTRLLHNCLEGVDDALARERPTADTNHLAFLTAPLADARHFLAATLGVPLENPLGQQLEYGKTLDEIGELPPLATLVAAWDRVSAHLAERLPAIASSTLDAHSGLRFPVEDRTVLGAVAFLVQHDSYHIGQMAFLRRQLGLGRRGSSLAVGKGDHGPCGRGGIHRPLRCNLIRRPCASVPC